MNRRQGALALLLTLLAGCTDYPADEPPDGSAGSSGGSSTATSGGARPSSGGARPSSGGARPSSGGVGTAGMAVGPAGAAGGGGSSGMAGAASSTAGAFGGPSSGAEAPGGYLDLSRWKLTLPVGSPGAPDEVRQPELAAFSLPPYFHLNDSTNGVLFRAHAGGVTTSGSSYPRSELREMASNGKDEAEWRTTVGTHTLSMTAAVTHLPKDKDQIVVAQIHDTVSDVLMVRLTGKTLYVEGDGQNFDTLSDDYALGSPFKVKIVAGAGRLQVFYDDRPLPDVDVARDVAGCYFKAGVYTQANTTTDPADSYGETIIYELAVSHE